MLRIGHNLPRRPTCKSRTISTNQWSKDMFLHQRSLSELNPLILRLPNGNLPLRIHEGRWKMELTGWKYLIRLQFISINKFLTGFPDSSPYLTHFICSTRKPSIWMMLQSKQKPKPERKNFLKGFQQVEKGLHCLACTLPRPIYIYILFLFCLNKKGAAFTRTCVKAYHTHKCQSHEHDPMRPQEQCLNKMIKNKPDVNRNKDKITVPGRSLTDRQVN
jgi:hypothetical protein